MLRIPERIKKMRKPKGFYDLWMDEVRKGKKHEDAYRSLEEEYEAIWGETRYASFNSFRISQSERIRNCRSTN